MPRSSRCQFCENSFSKNQRAHSARHKRSKIEFLPNLHRVYPAGVDRNRQAGVYKGDMKRGLAPLRQRQTAPATIARIQQNCRLIVGVSPALSFSAGAFHAQTETCAGRSHSPHRHLQHRAFDIFGGGKRPSSTAADNHFARDYDTVSVTISGALASVSALRQEVRLSLARRYERSGPPP